MNHELMDVDRSNLPEEDLFVCRGSDLIKLKIRLQTGDLVWSNNQWLLVNLGIEIQENSIYAIKI